MSISNTNVGLDTHSVMIFSPIVSRTVVQPAPDSSIIDTNLCFLASAISSSSDKISLSSDVSREVERFLSSLLSSSPSPLPSFDPPLNEAP